MFWGFGFGLFLLPLLFLGHFFWFFILLLLIWSLIRMFSFRSGHRPYYHNYYGTPRYGVPPVQPSALEILRQRYARGEIDAVTYEQMRERLEASAGPRQQ